MDCTIKQLPADKQVAAADEAVRINPANAPPFAMMGLFGEPTRERIAVMTSKYWGTNGVHLTVGFFGNHAAALQEKIVEYLNKWSQHGNIQFTLIGNVQNAQVRISLGPGGYYSYLGVDVLQIPRNEQTMNLEGFSLTTPESEFRRVVTHEAGHTLGCPHEHQRREFIALLDEQKTLQHFMATQGWTADEVRQQVLQALEDRSFRGTPQAQLTSIMAYGFPGSITKNGQPIPGGSDITPEDGAFIGQLYPKAVQPPTPPVEPPTPPTSDPMALLKKQVNAIFNALIMQYARYKKIVYILRMVQIEVLEYIDKNSTAIPAAAMSAPFGGLLIKFIINAAMSKLKAQYPEYADIIALLQSLLDNMFAQNQLPFVA